MEHVLFFQLLENQTVLSCGKQMKKFSFKLLTLIQPLLF